MPLLPTKVVIYKIYQLCLLMFNYAYLCFFPTLIRHKTSPHPQPPTSIMGKQKQTQFEHEKSACTGLKFIKTCKYSLETLFYIILSMDYIWCDFHFETGHIYLYTDKIFQFFFYFLIIIIYLWIPCHFTYVLITQSWSDLNK